MRITTRRGVASMLAITALIAAGCGGDDNGNDEGGGGSGENTGGEFVDLAQLSSAGDNTTFDPAAVQTLDEAQVTNALYDGLTDFDFTDAKNPKLEGLVAEKVEPNSDATVWTFTLKKDAVFSDGTPVLPSNFKKAWERAGSKELASPYGYFIAYVKGGEALQDGSATTLDGVVADDEARTLTVTTSAPNSDFGAIVSHSFFSPVANADLEKFKNTTPGWGADKGATIGNGPFKLQSADETAVVLVPNDKWGGNILGDTSTKLSKLTFKISQDVDSAFQAFESGEGMSATIPSGRYADATQKYTNTTDTTFYGSYHFLFGQSDPQLMGPKNLKLRQAISMAIDRDEINKKVYEGGRKISTGITPEGIPGFKADLCKFCKTDPAGAKKLIEEWKAEGNTVAGPIKLDYNEGGGHSDVAQIVQANLKDVLGIDATLNPISEGYFGEIAKEGGCHLCRAGWFADYPAYSSFMYDLFATESIDGNNLARYSNPEFDKLVKEAQATTDETKRGELWQKAEEIVLNTDTVAVPLNWYTGDQVHSDNVQGYDQNPLGMITWERISVGS